MASKSSRNPPKAGTSRHISDVGRGFAAAPDTDVTPHYLDHRQRLRARFVERGAEAMPDYELMELVLFAAIPRRDVKPLAKHLIDRFGSFADAIAAPRERLLEVDGIGEAVVAQLKIVEAAALRLSRTRLLGKPALSSWTALIDYCAATMARNPHEEFRILFLDRKNVLIADEVQGQGTVDHTPVYPREIVKRALELSASAHHPRAQPSQRRSHAVPRRHCNDARDRQCRQGAAHRRPRPPRRRPRRHRQFQGAGVVMKTLEGSRAGLRRWLHRIAPAALLLICMALPIAGARAAAAVPPGVWLMGTKVAVQIFDCRGKLCGRVIWLKASLNPEGLLKRDKLNPDPALRQRQVCGPTIIWNLRPNGKNGWTGGWFYNADDGATYRIALELTSADVLTARIYVGNPGLRENQEIGPGPDGHIGRVVLTAASGRHPMRPVASRIGPRH